MMNEEERKKAIETANWEELTQKDLTNDVEFGYYYEALVLRYIRGLKRAAILGVLNTIYKKVQHQQDKKEFASNIFLLYESPKQNDYELSNEQRHIISEWAETESEQPQQQENELPERVKKGLEDNVLLELSDNNKDNLKKFLLFCETAETPTKIARQAVILKFIKMRGDKAKLYNHLISLGYKMGTIANFNIAASNKEVEMKRGNK